MLLVYGKLELSPNIIYSCGSLCQRSGSRPASTCHSTHASKMCLSAPGDERGVFGGQLHGLLQGVPDVRQAPHVLPAARPGPLPALHPAHSPAGCRLKAAVGRLKIVQGDVQRACSSSLGS